MMPITLVRVNLFYSVYQIKGYSFPEITLTDAARNNVLRAIWVSISPVKLTQKINLHTCFIISQKRHHTYLLLKAKLRSFVR